MYWGNHNQKQKKIEFLLNQYAFLKKIDTVVPYFPDQIDLDITNRCNLSCITCFHSIKKFRSLPDMTMDTFCKVLDQAEGVSSTITLGNHGEPFLHKQVLDMIKEVKTRGYFLNIINNATFLNAEYAQALIDIGVDRVSFSLDTVDPAVYPKIRRGGDLKKALSNVLNFIQMNYKQGLKVYVNISTVNSRLALNSKPGILEFFSDLPVHVIYTSDILNFHDMLEIRDETKFVQHGYEELKKPSDLPICLNGFDRILVRPNGNVSLCPIDWDSVHVLGNIHEIPYTELWNNERAIEFRRALIDRDYKAIECDKVMCSRCDGKWVQDIRERPRTILNIIQNDINYSKLISDQKLSLPQYGTALKNALRFLKTL